MNFPFLRNGVSQEREELNGDIVIKSICPVTATKCRPMHTTIVDWGLFQNSEYKILEKRQTIKFWKDVQNIPIKFVMFITL